MQQPSALTFLRGTFSLVEGDLPWSGPGARPQWRDRRAHECGSRNSCMSGGTRCCRGALLLSGVRVKLLCRGRTQALCLSLSIVSTDLAFLMIALLKDKRNAALCSMCFSGNCNPDERERKDSNKGSEAKGGGTIDKTTWGGGSKSWTWKEGKRTKREGKIEYEISVL